MRDLIDQSLSCARAERAFEEERLGFEFRFVSGCRGVVVSWFRGFVVSWIVTCTLALASERSTED